MKYIFVFKTDYEDPEIDKKFVMGDGLEMSASQLNTSKVTCLLNKEKVYIPHQKGNIYKETEIFTCDNCKKYIMTEFIKIGAKRSSKSGTPLSPQENSQRAPAKILHKECFVCKKCSSSLINKKFSVREKENFCNPCFSNLPLPLPKTKLKTPTPTSKEEKEQEEKQKIDSDPEIENLNLKSEKEKEASKSSDLPPDLPINNSESIETGETGHPSEITCKACGDIIDTKTTSRYIRAIDSNWHTNCFICFMCKKAFEDSVFYNYEGKPCCLEDYKHIIHDKLPKCKGCRKSILGKCVATNNDNYHTDCFVCCVDGENIEKAEEGFFKKEGKFYCSKHYKEKFMDKCKVCKEYLEEAFLNVGGDKYHKKCFKCDECEGDVMKIGLTSVSTKEKKLICVNCAPKYNK